MTSLRLAFIERCNCIDRRRRGQGVRSFRYNFPVAVGFSKLNRAALIDVLVSNAGICPFADFLTMPPETWERTRQVNLDGSFYITQGEHALTSSPQKANSPQGPRTAVANQMKNQVPQGGSIIGISSISALVGGEYQW